MGEKNKNNNWKAKNHIGQGVKVNLAMELPKKPEKPKIPTNPEKDKK